MPAPTAPPTLSPIIGLPLRGLTDSEVRFGSVLRAGPCGELAPCGPAYHRPPSGGRAGAPFCPSGGAARPPHWQPDSEPEPGRAPRLSPRGLTEGTVRVGSVLRAGPCGELAPCGPAYHRPRSGAGVGTVTPFSKSCPSRGAARPPQPRDCHCHCGATFKLKANSEPGSETLREPRYARTMFRMPPLAGVPGGPREELRARHAGGRALWHEPERQARGAGADASSAPIRALGGAHLKSGAGNLRLPVAITAARDRVQPARTQ
jgi:hypothetical protein